jgi:hypothetical protein
VIASAQKENRGLQATIELRAYKWHACGPDAVGGVRGCVVSEGFVQLRDTGAGGRSGFLCK